LPRPGPAPFRCAAGRRGFRLRRGPACWRRRRGGRTVACFGGRSARARRVAGQAAHLAPRRLHLEPPAHWAPGAAVEHRPSPGTALGDLLATLRTEHAGHRDRAGGFALRIAATGDEATIPPC